MSINSFLFLMLLLALSNTCFSQTTKQDSLLLLEFEVFKEKIMASEEDKIIDNTATYKLLFTGSCPFSEVYPQSYDVRYFRLTPRTEIDSMLRKNFDAMENKYKLNMCASNLTKQDKILDVSDYMSPLSMIYLYSFGGKYLVIEYPMVMTYIGSQTSYGSYSTYYLEKVE